MAKKVTLFFLQYHGFFCWTFCCSREHFEEKVATGGSLWWEHNNMEKGQASRDRGQNVSLWALFFLVCTIVTYSLWFVFFLYLLGISFTDNWGLSLPLLVIIRLLLSRVTIWVFLITMILTTWYHKIVLFEKCWSVYCVHHFYYSFMCTDVWTM